ncbi:MAG: hypothetical protein IIA02_11355 [Proteobacteria bacterium]|uniref:sensor histidine kinase n=1 Tax=Aquabacterium sp. TaxID=1872578 RepID=UPI0035C74A92|nr:hypothetical protein [Pseudomonadota bacterium]
MASTHSADPQAALHAGTVSYQRFSELIFVSVVAHYGFAVVYGLLLGQALIAMAMAVPATLVLALFPLVRSPLAARWFRPVSHVCVFINFLGINLALLWMGLGAGTSVWWLVWWPLFIALVVGASDGLAWLALTLLAAALHWANDSAGWVPPMMGSQDNPLWLHQIGFLAIGVGFGAVARRAHDRYAAQGAVQHRTIQQQNEALLARARSLEGTLEALQQANLDRTRLFAQISHEVRNPLNGLLGFTQLLSRSPLTEHQRNHVEQVSRCGTAIHKIIGDMLDFSRLEANPSALEVRAFDAQQVAREVVEMLSSVAQQKGVPIVLECPPRLEAVGDALRVQQVLLNLLGNALKFTSQGQVTVRCKAVPTATGQAALHVEVQDSGIGIPAESVAQLFQPFSPVSEKTIRQYGGTGLGLAICKRLVDMMQGQIGVRSQPGQGSCFWFQVPLHGEGLTALPSAA